MAGLGLQPPNVQSVNTTPFCPAKQSSLFFYGPLPEEAASFSPGSSPYGCAQVLSQLITASPRSLLGEEDRNQALTSLPSQKQQELTRHNPPITADADTRTSMALRAAQNDPITHTHSLFVETEQEQPERSSLPSCSVCSARRTCAQADAVHGLTWTESTTTCPFNPLALSPG